MAKILIVDDIATNRRLLVAILEHEGHQIFEAVDGVDGLSVARVEIPDLVISDILMPSMDGYEFIRQLRAEPGLSHIPVIFHTAHYHEREARHLAQMCQVARVLVKPCSAEEILEAVRAAVTGTLTQPAAIVTSEFDREHLELITNKLSQQTDKLRAANTRLAALNALNVQLASERDASVLLERVCQEARKLLGASYSVLAVRDMKTDRTVLFSTSGLNVGGADVARPTVLCGALGKVVSERRSWRVVAVKDKPLRLGYRTGIRPPPRYWRSHCRRFHTPMAGCVWSTRWVPPDSAPRTNACCAFSAPKSVGYMKMASCTVRSRIAKHGSASWRRIFRMPSL